MASVVSTLTLIQQGTPFLENDEPCLFEFGGCKYTSATAAYEALKFFHRPDLMDRFSAMSAREALAFSAEKHLDKHSSWYGRRVAVMGDVLRAKFMQNPQARDYLLGTGSNYLAFHAPYKRMDPFWTDDADGSGANQLGHLLMQIRHELGGCGEPESHSIALPEIPSKLTGTLLDKSEEEILAEINGLNACMNEEAYRFHSQIARRPENLFLTRFPFNNFPYDATLVPLSSGRFINASFLLDKQFIGTQSPMPHTGEDFWAMVLEHRVKAIIMLNRLGDPGDDIYFPFAVGDEKQYGAIRLTLEEAPLFTTDPSWRQAPHEEEPHAVIHRKVKIVKDGLSCFVNHFQYQNWRDFSPGNERAAAYLVKAVEAAHSEGPIVIHCHAGVGRTSAMITLIDQYRAMKAGAIDVKRCVERQRSPLDGRCHSMMQSPEQYAFCYRTLKVLWLQM